MSRAALFQKFGWNALTIVTNSQPEPFAVVDFSFNISSRMRVEGVTMDLRIATKDETSRITLQEESPG